MDGKVSAWQSATLLEFAIYIYDRLAGNYLSPRGSLSHQDFCNCYVWHFLQRFSEKVATWF